MKLLTLTVKNFGVFAGRHDFDLLSTRSVDKQRNLVIVRGHNGAGKSTLFQAIRLALYGRLALGDRVSRQAYSAYLYDRLHRDRSDVSAEPAEEASVALSFEYIQSGEPLRIWVERRWQRSGASTTEEVEVTQDGKHPDVPPEDYEVWLSDYAPSGLARVSFFDAEQLNAFSDVQEQARSLKDSFEQLLGLNFVDRLRDDLNYYTQSRTRGQNISHLRKEVLTLQAEVEALESQLNEARENLRLLVEKENALEIALHNQQQALIAEGGRYQALRPELLKRKNEVEKEIEELSEQIRDLAAGLLPFALAPYTTRQLSAQLDREAKIQQLKVAGELWTERADQVERSLHSSEFWQQVDVVEQDRQKLIEKVVALLRKPAEEYAVDESQLLHRLSEVERKQIQAWLVEAQHVVPGQIQLLGKQLKSLKAEREQLDINLKRAPKEDVLAPFYEKVEALEKELAEASDARSELEGTVKVLEFQYDERTKQKKKAIDQLKAAQSTERQLVLAERSKSALAAFKDAMIRQQIGKLETSLVANFNTVCRKEHLLASARVDLDSFELTLMGRNGTVLNQNDFSAGEQQLLSLSLLWALRTLSKRELPLVIDTPLARLDEIHRTQLFERFFPVVSNQVLLFATDAEIDQDVMTVASPTVQRIYQLAFDRDRGYTTVKPLEFTAPPMKLYPNGANGTEIPLQSSPIHLE